jgi:hypothetical protein
MHSTAAHVKNYSFDVAKHVLRNRVYTERKMGKKIKVTRIIDVTEMGRSGGLATASNRTSEERRAAARSAAQARWEGHVAKRPASSRKKAVAKKKSAK